MQHQQQLDDFWQRLATITQDSGDPKLWKLSGDFAEFLAANRVDAVDWEYEAAQQGAESNGMAVDGGFDGIEWADPHVVTINITGGGSIDIDGRKLNSQLERIQARNASR